MSLMKRNISRSNICFIYLADRKVVGSIPAVANFLKIQGMLHLTSTVRQMFLSTCKVLFYVYKKCKLYRTGPNLSDYLYRLRLSEHFSLLCLDLGSDGPIS
jgi:hypothetical protein